MRHLQWIKTWLFQSTAEGGALSLFLQTLVFLITGRQGGRLKTFTNDEVLKMKRKNAVMKFNASVLQETDVGVS